MTILSILIALVVIGFVLFVAVMWLIGVLFDVPLPRGIRWR